jgi:hypothetical protein
MNYARRSDSIRKVLAGINLRETQDSRIVKAAIFDTSIYNPAPSSARIALFLSTAKIIVHVEVKTNRQC